VFSVRYELGLYIPDDDILHSHCRENLKSYTVQRLYLMSRPGALVPYTRVTNTGRQLRLFVRVHESL
jgi:hypothetical protein